MDESMALTPYETREILFYKTDNGDVRVEILLYQENLWLTQAKMAELFEVQKAAISKHLKNIFASGELMEDSVVSVLETTAADGKNYSTKYYNLDAIIAVGYRVNSKKATMVQSNLGVGFYPESMAAPALAAGTVFQIRLAEPIPERFVNLIEDTSRPQSVAMKAFKKMLLAPEEE